MMLEIKKVNNDQLDELLVFLTEIAVWLIQTKKSMWSLDKLEKESFKQSHYNSDCYLAYINGEAVSSIILSESDNALWPNIKQNETIFISKLGVSRKHSGKGISKFMLDFAYEEAKRKNKKYLRLDCYADRDYLCELYENYGFRLVKKREMHSDISAALFEFKIEYS